LGGRHRWELPPCSRCGGHIVLLVNEAGEYCVTVWPVLRRGVEVGWPQEGWR